MNFCADGDSIQRLLEDEGRGGWAVGVYFTRSAWSHDPLQEWPHYIVSATVSGNSLIIC